MTQSNDQVPFNAAAFADNPDPRCACLLLLDTSGSMAGKPISELNQGLLAFKDELLADSLAMKRVEIGIITFGPPTVVAEFQTVHTFQPPTLAASGDTPMGAAIELGIAMVQQRKNSYKQAGISYYRPWIFLLTDGAPTDGWQAAAAKVKEGEQAKAFSFFAVGVEGANMDVLGQIATRKPLALKGMRFRDLFLWLSSSLSSVSSSRVDEQVGLKNPAAPDGWASV